MQAPSKNTTPAPPEIQPETLIQITSSVKPKTYLNIRQGPGMKHNIIGTLGPGAPLVILDEQGNWRRVSTTLKGRQLEGWVYGKYITKPQTRQIFVRQEEIQSPKNVMSGARTEIEASDSGIDTGWAGFVANVTDLAVKFRDSFTRGNQQNDKSDDRSTSVDAVPQEKSASGLDVNTPTYTGNYSRSSEPELLKPVTVSQKRAKPYKSSQRVTSKTAIRKPRADSLLALESDLESLKTVIIEGKQQIALTRQELADMAADELDEQLMTRVNDLLEAADNRLDTASPQLLIAESYMRKAKDSKTDLSQKEFDQGAQAVVAAAEATQEAGTLMVEAGSLLTGDEDRNDILQIPRADASSTELQEKKPDPVLRQRLSMQPLIRINQQAHSAPNVADVAVDRNRRLMISVAADKTIKVWEIAKQRVLKTLRPPVSDGPEGKLNAVALSSKDNQIAVGGYTGLSWDSSASVYIFDLETGRMVHRISGFPREISVLQFSPDGKRLVVGVEHESSLWIYRTSDWGLERKLIEGQGVSTTFAQAIFGPKGNLLAILNRFDSLADSDGLVQKANKPGALDDPGKQTRLHELMDSNELDELDKLADTTKITDHVGEAKFSKSTPILRLYDKNLAVVAEQVLSKHSGKIAMLGVGFGRNARFSPDSSRLALGYPDGKVEVFSAADLSLLHSPDTVGSTAKGSPNVIGGAVAWSPDGRFLYSVREVDNGMAIRRWSNKGQGTFKDWVFNKPSDWTSVPPGRLVPMPEGDLLNVAMTGYWRLDQKGVMKSRFVKFQATGKGVFNQIAVSGDGTTFEFRPDEHFARSTTDSLRSLGYSEEKLRQTYSDILRESQENSFRFSLNSLELTTHFEPDAAMKGIDQQSSLSPGLCTEKIPFPFYTHWLSADGRFCLSLAEEFLALFEINRSGEPQKYWQIPSPGGGHGSLTANFSVDGNWIVVHFLDQTVQWLRRRDGKKVMTFYSPAESKEWILWTSEGYYVSSPRGDDLLGWHVNRGKDQAADFYTARQFERILYRPDFVRTYFENLGDADKTRRMLGENLLDINQLADIAPPRIILSPGLNAVTSRDSTPIKLHADRNSLPMLDYAVFVNSIPVISTVERRLGGKEQRAFTRALDIPLFSHENRIRVEVFNGTSMGVAETVVYHSGGGPQAKKGDLYLLAIGASRFPNLPNADLEYAALDAESLTAHYNQHGSKTFNRIHTYTVSDNSQEKPTRKNILKALDFIHTARAEDTVVVFLASHGLSDKAGNYYFVPRDAQPDDIRVVQVGRGKALSLVGWESFSESLRNSAGKRLLVVDTCQAKNITGTLDFHSLAKRSVSSSFSVMAASKGDEESQEYPPGRHGLFTYGMLQGLSGNGDENRDGAVKLHELFRFTEDYVVKNRDRRIPQSPQLEAPQGLRAMKLLEL